LFALARFNEKHGSKFVYRLLQVLMWNNKMLYKVGATAHASTATLEICFAGKSGEGT
jgi:hypothetical protein